MKTSWTAIAWATALSLLVSCPLSASAEAKAPQVVYNGEVLSFDESPTLEGTTVFAPFRPVFAKLGFDISWNEATGSVTASRRDLKLEFKPGSSIMLINGIVADLGVATRIDNGTTRIPLQPVTALAGARTVWNPLSQTLFIKPDLATTVNQVLQYEASRLTYEGDAQFGLKTGYGKLYLDGQLWYEGKFKNNKLDDAGKLYENGRLLYEGGFSDNQPSGSGTMYYPNGDKYAGQFAEGKPHGNGDFYIAGKIAYSGQWKNGIMEGLAKLYTQDGKIAFEGTFAGNQRTGYGVSFYPDGKKEYVGDWKNGLKDGQGSTYDALGKISYQGGWKQDKKDGPGMLYSVRDMDWIYTDQDKIAKQEQVNITAMQPMEYRDGVLLKQEEWLVYAGDKTKDGLPNGKGTLSYLNERRPYEGGILNNYSLRYEGEFRFGKMSGKGKLYGTGNELQYEGELQDGKRHGQGKSFLNGVVHYEGGWYEDKESGTGRTYVYDSEFQGKTFTGQASAMIHEGQYEAGKLIKQGHIYKYYGAFAQGKANGYGSLVMLYDADSDTKPHLPFDEKVAGKLVYEGEFKDGLREGKGKEYKDNQLVYEGAFKGGWKEGSGKYYEDSTVYDGPFVGNMREGKAVVTDRYGTKIFEGYYKNDMKNGYGTQYDMFGKKTYEGEFKNDKRHGYGRLYNDDGETTFYEGEFREDKTLSDYLQDR